MDEVLSNEGWGTTPIRQDTPWELPPSPTQPNPPTQQQPPPSIPQAQQQASQQQQQIQQPQLQPGGDFPRAPGPSASILDASAMASKPFGGMAQRASTWSSFGTPPGSNDGDSEWPKTSTTAGISAGGNSMQPPTNAFDLVHEFEPGKAWHGSNLMKALDDDPPLSLGPTSMSAAFPVAYGLSTVPRSPTGSQFESSGIGTWSPIVKGGRPGSMWDGDGPDGRGDSGRFDDGTAIWGQPNPAKTVGGVDWVDKSGGAGGDTGANIEKSRQSNMAGNNQATFRPQSSSSSASLLMSSSNTSPSSQQNRNQQHNLNKPSTLSHNFDQVQQQSNALSSQANQPNRGPGLSSNVPSKHQLNTMVQQIQLAVQAGHLNPQILNQPLAPITLQLLYQLLQQIRSLHSLQMKFNQPGSHQAAFGVQMNKIKQNILSLQNQIAAQQAIYLKQTQQAHNISSRQPTMSNLATGGMGSSVGPTLPPGISQSGDSFRSSNSINDFHGQAMVNNFGTDSMGTNGLATSLSHMSLGGGGGAASGGGGAASMLHSSRFNQPWRAPANKQHQSTMGSSSSFANHNLMNAAPGGMQKSMLNSAGIGNGGSSFMSMQQGGEFARAPGPASSMMDNSMTPKPFGMPNRSSTWSAFGNSSSSEPEPEWPKTSTTSSEISSSNSTHQPSNAFDLVPEFEPGKPWRGSMLMKSVEDDPTMTPGSMARSLAPQRKTIWSDEIL